MTTMFLGLVVGSLPLFLLLSDRTYGMQTASMITGTLFAIFFTFAATRGLNPYKFTCPAVKPQVALLLWRHVGFLVALFVLQTSMLTIRPHLPDWWNMHDKSGSPPFDLALLLLCLVLGFVQVRSNRSLLGRAHREFSR
jgi:hypothetical protein